MNIIDKLNRLDKCVSNINNSVELIYDTKFAKNSSRFQQWEDIISNNGLISKKIFDINFYDYDGTILYSYDKDEFLSLTEFPSLPIQSGLICQGWNWDLSHAKEYVSKYGNLNIGATYTTDNGDTRLYIDLLEDNIKINLTFYQSVSSGVTINWGDGTSGTVGGKGLSTAYHSYSAKGEYIISLSVVEGCEISLSTGSINEVITPSIYLKKVEFGDSTTVIRAGAFYSCYSLQSVTIPNSVTTIDASAFSSCYSLQSVIIPNSVTTIDDAFSYCTYLQNVVMGDSVTTIDGTFDSCYSLQSITIPDSVTTIGNSTFGYCYALQSITIPDSVTEIGNSTFGHCYALQSITIPDSVTEIGGRAFQKCHSLQSITIPDSITAIERNAFDYCYSLRSITIPDSVTSVGVDAFSYCTSLQNIAIPDSVTTIGGYAFSYCTSLQSVTIPDSVTSVGASAFNNCFFLQNVIIGNSVTSISSKAFYNCYSLQNITIPESVTSIGDQAFYNCYSLQYIDFTSHTSIPTLETEVFNSNSSILEIRVPAALYNDWCNATNWSTYKDYIKHGLLDATDITYNSLSITADDVGGRRTNTTIYYTVNVTGTNKWTGEAETVDMLGTTTSDSFPQNTSTTDTVERTITFELEGLTATTTITQGVWEPAGYTIDLNGQWQLSSKPNPDSSLYDGVYESFSNYNVNSGYATMYIDIWGYDTFKLYIRSYAESNYDYVMVSQLDQDITGSTSYSNTTLVKAHTRGNQQSGTALGNYTLVEFTGIDTGEHRITIVYRKDSSGNSGDDRGYVFVERIQPTFRISRNGEIVYTSQFINGMTWNDYIESDYNTGNFGKDPETANGITFAPDGNVGPGGSGYILNDADGYPISNTDLIVNGSTYHTGSAGGPT